MTRSSVKNLSESYSSLYSSVTTNSVIYSELSSCVSKYLRIDFVQKCCYFVSHSQILDEFLKASTFWNIKNVEQLQHWVKQNSKVFLKNLNNLWTQRDLDVKACELFDKISSEQIWKTRFEKIDRAKKQLNQLNQTLQNKLTEAQHYLQVTRNVTSLISILFTFSKWSQKLSNSSLFTDENESIWDDWQEKIRNKLKINVDHFNNDRIILIYIHSWISEDTVKVTLVKHQWDSLNSYSMIDDLLDELAQLYDDSDKETNFRRKYANLSQEKSKFSDFYSMFQHLFFYLKYHEKQLIVDLRDKIVYHFHAAWSNQLIQSESLNEIRDYLIHLNNEHRVMNDIKEKKFMIKIVTILVLSGSVF